MSTAEATTPATAPATSLGFHTTALEAAKAHGNNVAGKVFVVTGAYSGIGTETVKALLAEGGNVVLGGRSEKLQSEFVEELQKTYDASKIDGGCLLDLGDLESVKKFADYVRSKCDAIVLINNAGVMASPPTTTKQGFESQMGINVIGHFLLSKLLVDKTKRQVWLSSSAHTMLDSPAIDIEKIKAFKVDVTKDYNPWAAYQQSKLGDILLAKEFHKRYGVESAALHPGVIKTNLSRHLSLTDFLLFFTRLPRLMMQEGWNPFKTTEQGASTTITVATTSDLVNGAYYKDCQVFPESESARNEADAAALFDFCDQETKGFQ